MTESPTTLRPAVETAKKPRGRAAFEAFSVSSLGLEMGAAVLIGWGVGSWLDRKYDTDPLLMLVFLLFGVAAGFRGLYRVAKQTKRASEESN